MSSLPAEQYSIKSHNKVHAGIKTTVEQPKNNDVLIANEFVASNPKDWKYHDPDFIQGNARVDGNDIAGTVVAVGDKVTRFKVGDRVSGMTPMLSADKYGAYQQYTHCPEHSLFKVADNVKFEDAVSLSLAGLTAALGLFVRLGLPLPENGPSSEKTPLLIYGAGTSVGAWAVKFASLAGFRVIAVAGGSKDLALKDGAEKVVDYRNKSQDQLISEIIEAFGQGVKVGHAYDAHSSDGSPDVCARVLTQTNGGGKLVLVLPAPKDTDSKDYFKNVSIDNAGVWRAHGDYSENTSDDHRGDNADFAQKFFDLAGKWFAEGKITGHPIKVLPNGLDSVQEGLQLLKDNKVSGQKLVYRIADTPALKQ